MRFFETAAVSCACENFGLRLAQNQDLTLLGPIWPVMQSATAVAEMLSDLARYFLLHTTGALISLESLPQGVLLNYSLAAGIGATDRHTMEVGLGIIVGELQKCQPGWTPKRVLLRHSAPKSMGLHRQILGRNISFNADRNAILIDTELLRLPFGSGDSVAHQTLASRFNQQRQQMQDAFRVQTETVIRSLLSFSVCDVKLVANVLRLSTRSLQRRLTEENTSFNAILDAVRADLALHYLRQSELPIGAIAEILGFSETSALTRAFQRWYGRTPRNTRDAAFDATRSA